MRRTVLVGLVAGALGVALGWVLKSSRAPADLVSRSGPVQTVDLGRPLMVIPPEGSGHPARRFVVHSVTVNGSSVRLADYRGGPSDVWLITFNGGSVVAGTTEDRP